MSALRVGDGSPITSYHNGRVTVWGGDCLDLMAALDPDSVDAIVTDPPYGLGFMGKKWDALPPGTEWAEACYRVLKPGGHILAFGGTRTWHRLAVAIEDGGFEIRDSLAWLYGSGFPKSMDVSKAIDKAARGVPQGGADPTSPNHGRYRTTTTEGKRWDGDKGQGYGAGGSRFLATSEQTGTASERTTAPTTPITPVTDAAAADSPRASTLAATAAEWEGWGTALKPAFEPIVVGRKPLPKGSTVATNVLAHGTGALNIDACRIASEAASRLTPPTARASTEDWRIKPGTGVPSTEGRWPANVVLDESQAEALDQQSGTLKSGVLAAHHQRAPKESGILGAYGSAGGERGYGDIGGASRFFYCAKAPKSERPVVELADGTKVAHPTVKPVAIMRWLVRLVTPPDGLVLDTFAGSGTTGEACVLEGFRCLLAEDPTKGEQDYLPLIDQRITRCIEQMGLLS